jgi:hypothetical protein
MDTDLLEKLEVDLTNLLQRVRGDPWSLLIFQTLIWSFRRWAIHYLMNSDTNGKMEDYIWDSHIDLVSTFAPDGLKEFATVWLNPSNVGDRIDILEELNTYFLYLVDNLDDAIENDDDEYQNNLAIFLDDTLTDILTKWLEGREEYKIYPGASEEADSFSSDRIFTIMQLILERHVRKAIPAEAAVEAPVEAAVEAPVEAAEPVVEAPPPAPTPVKETITSALRNRTMRVKRNRGSEKGTRKQNR